jgi:chitinase
MGFYGRGWSLNNIEDNGPYAPANQPIQAGPYTRQAGIWGYNEVCEQFLADPEGWTVVRNEYYKAPYAYNGRNWIGYDDMESLTKKVSFGLEGLP